MKFLRFHEGSLFAYSMRRLVSQSIVFCLVLVFVFPQSLYAAEFKTTFGFDVSENNKNREAIFFLHERGIIDGYEGGSFKPEQTVNRAEQLKILLEGQNISPDAELYKNCFPDVREDWFAKYVCYAKEQKWIQGYSDGTFRPSQTVNKVEAIKMLIETHELGNELPQVVEEPLYEDVDQSSWYAPYLYLAKKKGLLEETTKEFVPSEDMSRGGISENLYRLIQVKELQKETFPGVQYEEVKLSQKDQNDSVVFVQYLGPQPDQIHSGAKDVRLFHFTLYTNRDIELKETFFTLKSVSMPSKDGKAGRLFDETFDTPKPNYSNIRLLQIWKDNAYAQVSGPYELEYQKNDTRARFAMKSSLKINAGESAHLALSLDVADNAELDGDLLTPSLEPISPTSGILDRNTQTFIKEIFPVGGLIGNPMTLIYAAQATFSYYGPTAKSLPIGGENVPVLKFLLTSPTNVAVRTFTLGIDVLDGDENSDEKDLIGESASNFQDIKVFDVKSGRIVASSETLNTSASDVSQTIGFSTNSWQQSEFEVREYAVILRIADNASLENQRIRVSLTPQLVQDLISGNTITDIRYLSPLVSDDMILVGSLTPSEPEVSVMFQGPSSTDVALASNDVPVFKFTLSSNVDAEVMALDIMLEVVGADSLEDSKDILGKSAPNFSDVTLRDAVTGEPLIGYRDSQSGSNVFGSLSPSMMASDIEQQLGFSTAIWKLKKNQKQDVLVTLDVSNNPDLSGQKIRVTLLPFSTTQGIRETSTGKYIKAIVPTAKIVGNTMTLVSDADEPSQPQVTFYGDTATVSEVYTNASGNPLFGINVESDTAVEVEKLSFKFDIDTTGYEAGLLNTDKNTGQSVSNFKNLTLKAYRSGGGSEIVMGPKELDTTGSDFSQIVTFTDFWKLSAGESASLILTADIADNSILDGEKITVSLEKVSTENGIRDQATNLYVTDIVPNTSIFGSSISIKSRAEKKSQLTLSLGSGNPSGATVLPGDKMVPYLSVDFDSTGEDDVTIQELVFRLTGIHSDFGNVYLSNGNSLLATANVNGSDNNVVFSNLNLAMKAHEKISLTLNADMSSAAIGGNSNSFELLEKFSSDADNVILSHPLKGNAMKVATVVQGVFETSQTWTLKQSPYVVTGDILVNSGTTLTIEPGVEVRFNGKYYIRVDGELIAIGTSGNKILFTSNKTNPSPGDWNNIFFKDSSVDAVINETFPKEASNQYVSGSIIQYAEIQYGTMPIIVDSSSPFLANNHIHDNAKGTPPKDWPTGTILLYNSNSTIQYNTIENNQSSGITLPNYGGKLTIIGNQIRGNKNDWGGGIALFGGANNVYYNIIEKNEATVFGGGIAIYSGSHTIQSNVIRSNINNYKDYPRDNAKGGSAVAFFSGGGPISLKKNDIYDNIGPVALFFTTKADVVINDNTIMNPLAEYEIYLNTSVPSTFTMNAENNYWGYTDLSEVGKRIWEYGDSFDLGHVDFDPILLEFRRYNP